MRRSVRCLIGLLIGGASASGQIVAAHGPQLAGIAPGVPNGPGRPMTVDDILAVQRPSSVELSPDGRQVTYVVNRADLVRNQDRAELYVTSINGRRPPQRLAKGIHIRAVRWTPDSRRLVYSAETGTGTQIWEVDLASHAIRPLTPATLRIHSSWEEPAAAGGYIPFDLANDGRWLVYAVDDTVAARKEMTEKAVGGVVYRGASVLELTDLKYRRVPIHLRLMDLKTGVDRIVWGGRGGWAGFRPEFAVAPDGRHLAVLDEGGYRVPYVTNKIILVNLVTGRQEDVANNLGDTWGLRWAEGGKALRFVSNGPVQNSVYSQVALYTLTLSDGSLHRGSDDIGGIIRSDASRSGTGAEVAAAVERREPGKFLSSCSLGTAGTRAACVLEAPMIPPEVVSIEVRAGGSMGAVRPLTRLNARMAGIELGAVSELKWQNRTGTGNAGLIMPAGYLAGKQYPLVVMLYNSFSGRQFIADAEGFTSYPAQAFAGHGYVVLLPNLPKDANDYFASSGGFCKAKALEGDGVADAIRAGVDTLLARGVVDTTRMGIMGWSFGGFLAPYILIQHPTWFRAGAIGEGGNHYPSAYWIGDTTWRAFEDFFFGGGPFGKARARWEAISPVLTAGRLRAPLLMEYSGAYQLGLELHEAIIEQGGQAEMVNYPDDEHVLYRPRNRFASMTRHYDWFNFWLLGEEDAALEKREQYQRWHALREARNEREKTVPIAAPTRADDGC
jgi:dipeptidyl aminopeptidase/acylaminoacyl peptidase